jgi:hypothetical protein
MITQASIDTVISTADIVREVERAGVKLSRSGSGKNETKIINL